MNRTLLLLLFVGLAALAYSPSFNGEFIMDDWGYITQNADVVLAPSPVKFWTTFETTDYWPLTYTGYWILYRIFGENPLGYHLVNIVLHAGNAFLLFLLATELGLPWALFAGLLFLLHPLHVQAVSWIAQFKTLLSTGLVLLSLLAFVRQRLHWSLGFFSMSLMAKTSALFLPFAYLLMLWPQRRTASKRLAPFFALSLVGGLITLYVNSRNFHDRDFAIFKMPWYERLLLVPQNLAFYLKNFVFPYPRGFLYPPPGPEVWAWLVVLLGCFCWLRNRFFLIYLLLLAPCLGFVAIPNMKLSLVADHWSYLPNTFLCLFAAVLLSKIPKEIWAKSVSATILSAAATLTFLHAQTFASEEIFWRHNYELNPASPAAAYNLGTAIDKKNRIHEAIPFYQKTVELDPSHARAWNNLGRGYYLTNNLADARTCFTMAIAANKKLTVAYISLANIHKILRQDEMAKQVLQQGLRENPGARELLEAIKNF